MKHTIYLAGGCFWGVQAYMEKLPGVLETEAGYANGETKNPSYEEVCGKDTGHAETVRVIYDSDILPLSLLLKAFFKVVLPEIMPGIVTGMIMAFTLSIDDFVISYFTSGTTQTLPIYIYSMTRKRISPEINALSTVLFAVVMVLLIIINVRNFKDQNKSRKGEAAV